jgi:hypothetical protein
MLSIILYKKIILDYNLCLCDINSLNVYSRFSVLLIDKIAIYSLINLALKMMFNFSLLMGIIKLLVSSSYRDYCYFIQKLLIDLFLYKIFSVM